MENKTVLSVPEAKLNRLRIMMNQFKVRYPTENECLIPFEMSPLSSGCTMSCYFYSSDVGMRGMAFYMAYKAATLSEVDIEFCTCVGSMICDVYAGLRSSTQAALDEIGAVPHEVRLPSEARRYNIVLEANAVPKMDWPSMLVYFGCCIILIFKKIDEANYKTVMSRCIRELREIAGCYPNADLDIPFDFKRANSVRTMLGTCSRLREDAIRFIVTKRNSVEQDHIGGVCQYVCNFLSWSGMRHFVLINDFLVKPQSPVLLDPRVTAEVDNLTEACAAITSHCCPQFYMLMSLRFPLSMVEPFRFLNLIAVAQELEKGDNNSSNVADFELNSTEGADPTTVQALVNLHRNVMPHNRCPIYPKANPGQSATSAIGSLNDCNFYISDEKARRGMAFCVAYNDATQSKTNKKLCTSVASMICDVCGTEFKSIVEAALNGIGVRPVVVKLPSQAREYNIEEAEVPEMDWPSILVYFGCCVLNLFNKSTREVDYQAFMSSCIRDLQDRAGCDPDSDMEINSI